MFDIGFTELLILSLVALLVLGPERLPEALRTLGLWIGRLRRTVGNLQAELEREVGMDELRRELHNNRILEEARALERDLKDTDRAVRDGTRDLDRELRTGAADPAREREALHRQARHRDDGGAPANDGEDQGDGPGGAAPPADPSLPSGATAPPWDPDAERDAPPRDPYGDLDDTDLATGPDDARREGGVADEGAGGADAQDGDDRTGSESPR